MSTSDKMQVTGYGGFCNSSICPSGVFATVSSTHKRNICETPLPKRAIHRMRTPIEYIMRGSC